jgi:uncharacterized protein
MEMVGEAMLNAARDDVWTALNDPEVLRQAIPGCQSLERTSDTEFTATVVLKVGPIRAKFLGRVMLSDIDPPNSYTIAGKGEGGITGFAEGGAKVRLDRIDSTHTLLHYAVEANVGGKLAQLGGRLIDSTARKLAGEFFDRFGQLVSAAAEPAKSVTEVAQATN